MKLYRVEKTIVVYTLAASAEDAEDYVRGDPFEIDEEPEIVSHVARACEWNDGALVYGRHRADVTVREALEMTRVALDEEAREAEARDRQRRLL